MDMRRWIHPSNDLLGVLPPQNSMAFTMQRFALTVTGDVCDIPNVVRLGKRHDGMTEVHGFCCLFPFCGTC